jgi:hypothetical protein
MFCEMQRGPNIGRKRSVNARISLEFTDVSLPHNSNLAAPKQKAAIPQAGVASTT